MPAPAISFLQTPTRLNPNRNRFHVQNASPHWTTVAGIPYKDFRVANGRHVGETVVFIFSPKVSWADSLDNRHFLLWKPRRGDVYCLL